MGADEPDDRTRGRPGGRSVGSATAPLGRGFARLPLIWSRLLVWLVFTVVIGMLPLGAAATREALAGRNITFVGLLDNGELFIVSAVVAAAAIGDLFHAHFTPSGRNFRIVGAGSTILLALANAMAYAQVAADSPPETVATLSLVFFAFTVLTSGFCIGLAAGR